LLESIYEIVDGCAVQYRCGQVLYFISQIALSLGVRLVRCVQAPGHGKEEVDGLQGVEKTYADSIFARPGRLAEVSDGEDEDIKAPSHRMDINGVKVSLAKMMYAILSNPKRKFRYKDHEQKVSERRYHLRPVDDAATTHNVKMTAVGCEKKKGRYGIGSHYCFVGDPLLGLKIVTRRFFCVCEGCKSKLSSSIISERYSGPFDMCKYWPIFMIDETRGWNDTRILSFVPGKACDQDEVEETFVHTLKELGKTISRHVVVGGVGAYAVDDDHHQYYLVQWVDVPREIEEDEMIMVENSMMTVSKGDWVCEGKWFDRVERTKCWYTLGDTTVTVRMKNVLHADLVMVPVGDDNPLPRLNPTVRDHVLPLNPVMLKSSDHDFMMDEIGRREMLSHEEDIVDSEVEGHSGDDDDEEETDEEDDTDDE